MKKTIVGFLAVALFAPGAAFALFDCGATDCMTGDLLRIANDTNTTFEHRVQAFQMLVAHLKADLANLVAKKNGSVNTNSVSSCFVPTYDLYIGRDDAQTNGEVKKLQLWLKSEGYFPDAQGTGYYGDKTAEAVVKWQKAHGMDFVTTKSGVGKMTRAKMQEVCGNSKTTITGTYKYSDANTELASFQVPGTANEWLKSYTFGGNGGIDTSLQQQLIGDLHTNGDTCILTVDATLEIADPILKVHETKHQYDAYQARFVRVISKGSVYDECPGANGMIRAIRI